MKGHADRNERNAQSLADERAQRVRTILASEGVAARRITPVGYGSSMPVASSGTAAGRAENRRVEIEIRPNREVLESDDQGR